MRTLVVGDIHGGYKGLLQVLERAQVTPSDRLIFLGDYVDGWSESAKVITHLIQLSKTNSCVFVRGNHDLWCGQWLNNKVENKTWEQHGGKETIESYNNTPEIDFEAHKQFFNALLPYYKDSYNHAFLHAGFSSKLGIEHETDQSNYYFDRSLWKKAMSAHKKVTKNKRKLPRRLRHNPAIFIGHTPTLNFNETVPMNACNVWNLDTGAAFTGKLTLMDIHTKSFWQSDALMELYPNEKGRN